MRRSFSVHTTLIASMFLSCSSSYKNIGEVGVKMTDKSWCVFRWLTDIDAYFSDWQKLMRAKVTDRSSWNNQNVMQLSKFGANIYLSLTYIFKPERSPTFVKFSRMHMYILQVLSVIFLFLFHQKTKPCLKADSEIFLCICQTQPSEKTGLCVFTKTEK